ncbi:hypothetical protein [Mucilaginibacter psychrotolerans]|uniref:Uncharacterized protein n=1 Tax=Mucilaginibacter psychrotolerans TaxID=1524096 RepID=A0A4Y8SIU5_9SPHI|nr:hypothetical protein [Mucilaginibacter psychrotolerans]TFF38838.1 hypothetical protein E2R66_07490 [Mucilaginibacter psychrotolerans]
MTTIEILNLYGIKFTIFISPRPVLGKNRVRKGFIGGGSMENYFGSDFDTLESITEDVLPIVQHYINGNNPEMNHISSELGGSVDYAIPDISNVTFHNPNDGEIVQTIPIIHFTVIAEAWREFLLQKPIVGDAI